MFYKKMMQSPKLKPLMLQYSIFPRTTAIIIIILMIKMLIMMMMKKLLLSAVPRVKIN